VIVMDEKIVGVWYVVTILDYQDWLAALREIEPDAKYELTYRFRYYTGDQSKNPFDDGDKKNWYSGEVTGTRAYCIAALRKVAGILHSTSMAGQPLYETLNDRGIEQFMRDFQDLPFVYGRWEKKIPTSA
jgi:hypothetical protein